MSWNTLSARDKSAFMNVALRHGVTDLAAIKRAYDSLGDGNVMAGGGPAKTKEPPFSLAQRAAENRLRKAHLFDDGGDTSDDFESRLAKIDDTDAIKMRTMRGIEALYDSSLPTAELSARELVHDKASKSMYYPSELFLLDPDKQLTMMEGLGFIPGEPHDYGRVAAKVARSSNPDMPVYQRYPHDITRDKITPIGGGYRGETFDGVDRSWTFQVDNGWLIRPDGSPVYFDDDPKVNNIITKTLGADDWTDKKGLIDAGDYPFVLYRDDDGNFYVNAWDVNNYSDPMSPRFQNYNWWQKAGAKTLDKMGNPFVQTLGYKSLPLDGYGYAEKGSGYILPNVTVTPGKKAHGGKLNRFDDGGDVIDWGNVDLKAMRDAYQQSQEDNVRTYTAVPASRMSYNEGNGLWWDKDTGTWHTQDSLTFPGGDISGVTVAHNRNTGKDFVVPTSQYVRPLNTQDYFDHTGSNALEFASLMTSPTNLFMPSHIAGAIWDTRDKLSGKNPNINLWDSWLHENRGIGRTGNPYLDAGLNLVGDIAGFNSKNALRRAVLDAERFAGSSLFSLSDALASKGKAYKEAADQLVHNYSRLSPKYHDSSIVRALGKSAYKGLKRVSSASNAARNATLKPGLYLMSKYNEARDPIARRALEEIFTQKQDYLSQLARSYGLDYAPGTSPYIMARDLPIDYSGKYFMRGPRGYDSGTYGSYRNVSDAPEESFIAINPTMSRVSDREFASLFKHEGTHAFDRSPSTRSFMYDVAKHEHPEFHVFPSRGIYRSDYMFALDGDHFWTPIDNMHRATHKVRDLYYPEEFSKKARSVMPIARGVRLRRIQSHSDVERNADLTEIRARFARKLGLDPMSPGFNEAFANEVQALPDKRFFILNPGSKPRFTVFDGIEDSYTRDWTDGLMQQYENFNGYAYTQQAFVRDFIDTMKDLLINYRANGGRLNKFDGLDNLDRPNQMAMAFDDLVAARDRYAQTGDINTSWEPVDLNDVSITDNGFITREGRTGNSFVLPEATIIGQRPVVNEATLEEESDDNSFLGGLRAARNRVKYGHSALTEEDKAMTRRANKVAAAGSAAIAGSVLAPYLLPYAGTALNAMQPSTYLDAIASGLGANVGNYGLGASTMAGALGNAALASEITAEGLGYLYNTYLAGNNQRSLGEDINASLALAPFLVAPAAGAKKLLDLSRSGRLMTRLEHANRLTRYLSAPRRARRYVHDYEKSIEELRDRGKAEHEELTRRFLLQEKFAKTYGKEDNFIIKRVPQIDLSKASKENILKYLRKHDLPEDMFMFNEKGEPIIGTSNNPIFNSGRIEVPVFGTNEVKAFDITHVGGAKNLRTGAIAEFNGKQYDAKKLVDYYKLTRDNIKYVEKATGGKAFGSSAMVGFEEVPHATHDYDVLVTEEMADKKMRGWRDNFSNGLTHYQLDGGKYGGIGDIDVNVIEKGPDGKAAGTRAMELFRQFFPEEYGKQAEAAMLNNLKEQDIKITKTPQELLDAYDPVTKTVMDALEIDYTQSGKEKHATRILGYLAYSQNPKSVAKGIGNFAKMLVGKDYRPVPKLDFSDRETNIKFIDEMFGRAAGAFRRIADSPERMQNLFDMFYLGETTYVRELSTQLRPVSKAVRDRVLNLWPNEGGTVNGKLINAVKGNRSGHGNQIVVSQIPVELKEGESIADAWKKISRATGHKSYTFTDKDLAADSRIGAYLGIDVGDDTSMALHKISKMSDEPITEADNVLRDPERFQAILNDPFYRDRHPTDQRASIASDILNDNGIYGLENGFFGRGPYISVVENLPYVSRQNLYWPGGKSFKSLRERAGDIRESGAELRVVWPVMVGSHNGKSRFIENSIGSMANKTIKEPVESPMGKTRKRLNDEINALRDEHKNTREIRKLQERRLRNGTELLKGNSLGHMETVFKYNKRENTNNAIINGSLGLFGIGLAGSVPLMVKGYAENQGKYVSEAMRNLYGDEALSGLDEDQARRFYDEHKDEIDAEIKWTKHKHHVMRNRKTRAEKREAFGQALRNLYGEDYYKNFSEDNPGADYDHFINEHKDELNAEVDRIIRKQREARLEKEHNKKR